jgi:hypothetical protein
MMASLFPSPRGGPVEEAPDDPLDRVHGEEDGIDRPAGNGMGENVRVMVPGDPNKPRLAQLFRLGEGQDHL